MVSIRIAAQIPLRVTAEHPQRLSEPADATRELSVTTRGKDPQDEPSGPQAPSK
jgi:hypothetical protein